ncbi:MAG: hypothetical protein ACRDRN_17545 [Sciscionella sp.]
MFSAVVLWWGVTVRLPAARVRELVASTGNDEDTDDPGAGAHTPAGAA